jgi:hypothetical protein
MHGGSRSLREGERSYYEAAGITFTEMPLQMWARSAG